MTGTLIIGDYAHSSWSLRGWLLFEKFGLSPEIKLLDFKESSVAAQLHGANPARTVPTWIAPEGTVVRPVLPGPCGARGITGYRMIDCLFGALAQVAPDRVTADGSGGSTLPTISGWQDGRLYVFCETAMGTWGASRDEDGQEGMPHIGANQSNIPVEMIEKSYPLRIEHYGYVTDSGGPGRRRGGMAIRRDYRLLADRAMLNVRSDKRDFPPHGLYGGCDGQPSMNRLISETGERILPVLLSVPVEMRRGDVFSHVMASGGGYGPAHEREPDRVLQDVRLGKVSREGAERDYGVVIEGGRPETLRVDPEATRQRRAGRTVAAE